MMTQADCVFIAAFSLCATGICQFASAMLSNGRVPLMIKAGQMSMTLFGLFGFLWITNQAEIEVPAAPIDYLFAGSGFLMFLGLGNTLRLYTSVWRGK